MSKLQMAKISPKLKEEIKKISENRSIPMSDLIRFEFRQMLKDNGLPTL